MSFLIYNVIFSALFSFIYYIGEKTELITSNMFDIENMNFMIISFLITLVLTTIIQNKIKDYV